jgi:hypothetical protein
MMMSNNQDGGNSPLASVMDEQEHANRLVEQVPTCVKCAFLERDKIDVNPLAFFLAVLCALLQTESIASVIEPAPLSALFEEVVDRLPDPRFADQNGPYVASAEELIGQ